MPKGERIAPGFQRLIDRHGYGMGVHKWKQENPRMKRLNLRGADLSGQNLYYENLAKADLSGANCSNAIFRAVDLQGATLAGAHLSEANFRRADLRGANLQSTECWNVDFQGANLENVVFMDANLREAKFFDANLKNIELTRAKVNPCSHELVIYIIKSSPHASKAVKFWAERTLPGETWFSVAKQLLDRKEQPIIRELLRVFYEWPDLWQAVMDCYEEMAQVK